MDVEQTSRTSTTWSINVEYYEEASATVKTSTASTGTSTTILHREELNSFSHPTPMLSLVFPPNLLNCKTKVIYKISLLYHIVSGHPPVSN